MKVRAKQGKRLGGSVPYGYTWKDGKLEINEEGAAVRRLVFELFLEKKRKKAIVTILNERGYRTRKGTKFHDTGIKRWLRDPLSKGLRRSHFTEQAPDGSPQYKPKDEWVFHEAPAIVSEEIWQKTNDILDEQERSKEKPLNRLTHLFTRYIYCSCGARMSVRSGNKFYCCTDTTCQNKIVREDLEEIFKSQLTQFVISPEDINKYLESSENTVNERKRLLQSRKKRQEQLETDIKKIVDLHLKGQIPTEAFKDYHEEPYNQLQQIKKEIAQLEGEILALQNQQEANDYIISEAKSIYGNWDNLTREDQRAIVETITDKIIIGTDDSINIHLKKLLPEQYLFENHTNGQRNPGLR